MNQSYYSHLALLEGLPGVILFALAALILFAVGGLILMAKFYRKVEQGQALVRNGQGGTKVTFKGIMVIPVLHKAEEMDISVKRIEIDRSGTNGLICKDNIRADIKVAFFVRVNNLEDDVISVARSIGCERASSPSEIENLFDAKFSEALKTVGKRFDFTELYEERDTFREEILKVIGTDLNGFVLDDCAIDHLEQTPLEVLDPTNILDAEGIKKITDITAREVTLANQISKDKEKTIKQQNVAAEEAILELDRQLEESKAKQAREISTVQSREEAEAKKVEEEERFKSEQARIATEEELAIATENKDRQILVAQRNKERTDAVELERVERERMIEEIERKRVTELKSIEAEKAVEIEKKEIQDVIAERVMVEKAVVVEKEKIKDTEADAGADREKRVAITLAEKEAEALALAKIKDAQASKDAAMLKAEEELYETLKEAEASKSAAELEAEELVITAEAMQSAAEKESAAKQMLAEATAKETAAAGLGEAEVIRAQASAEAEGIKDKAEAMKLFEEAGQEHEEFKLELEKAKAVELAEIDVQRQIAAEQAAVVGEALKSANIDIVGGETEFFDRITNAITRGKSVDRILDNSETLTDVKETFFNGDGDAFKANVQSLVDKLGLSSEDLKNLSVAGLLTRLGAASKEEK